MMKIYWSFLCLFGLVLANTCALTLVDDFNNNSLSNWTVQSGNWSAANGVATSSNAPGTFEAFLLEFNGNAGNDFSFQADVRTSGGNSGHNAAGLAFRVQDKDNFYAIWIHPDFSPTPGALQLLKRVNGVQTFLAADVTLGFIPSRDVFHTMRLDVVGSDYTISVKNGAGDSGFDFVTTFSDTTFTGGGVGLTHREGTSSFDNVKLNSTAVPEPTSLSLFLLCLSSFALRTFLSKN